MSLPASARSKRRNEHGSSKTQFLNLQAAADFLGNGAIEINKYESEIYDIIRRTSVFLVDSAALSPNVDFRQDCEP
jgi:hypothetical protein